MYALRKTTTLAVALALALALLFGVLAMFGSKPSGAIDGPEVQPEPIEGQGNFTCASQGYDYELKIESGELAEGQTYTAATTQEPGDSGPLSVTLSNLVVNGDNEVTQFDWASNNFAVDAVIVKAKDSHAFIYDPPQESMGDDGLFAPEHKGISHISFCYDLELQVTKDAETSFTRTNTWDIEKSVTPGEWELFTGDSGTSDYVVSVDKTVTDSDYAVNGTITIKNPAPDPAQITEVTDVISQPGSDTDATVTCQGVTSFPYTLAANGTLTCTYDASLQSGEDGTNTATATTSSTSKVNSGSGTAGVDFGDPTTVVGPNEVSVVDNVEGNLGTFNDDGSAKYSQTFTCDGDEGSHNNTATITETEQSASASVTVNCHALTVTKDANTSFKRTYGWTIVKTASPTEKTIATGESFPASYFVSVDATPTDGDHAVSGNISVSNPAGAPDATINSVSDVVSGVGGNASVDCGVGFPYTLAAGETLDCTYSTTLPDAQTRTNTATATLQNHSFNSAGTPTGTGTTDFSGSAAVNFDNASMTETDEEITVSDPVAGGNLGTATAGASGDIPKTFPYSQTIGPYSTCGDKTVDNTASFVTNDTGATGSDTATVTAHVQCKLTVIKKLDPTTDTGKFNLLIDGVVKAGNVGHDGTTEAQAVALGDHTVSETAGTGTNLSDYVSKIKCNGANEVSGTSTTVNFKAGDSDKTCTITNTRKAKAKVVKTVNGQPPSGTQEFTFQLRQNASTTNSGTILESKVANASNGGVITFATGLIPGQTYQLCEIVMPGWSTSLGTFVPDSFMPPDGVAPNPNVDNSILCVNFTPQAGETKTFTVDNTPPPGGRALTIGFWKNWASCSGGNQKPVLDQTLAKAEPTGVVISAQSGSYPAFAPTYYLVLHGSTATPNKAPDCLKAVRLLNKSTIDKGTKNASDPAFNLAAQLLAAQLNYTVGAGKTPTATSAINQAVVLLGKYKFNGITHSKISAADATTMNNLAKKLDDYNNNRP